MGEAVFTETSPSFCQIRNPVHWVSSAETRGPVAWCTVLPVFPVSVSRGGGFFTLGLTGVSETPQIIITFLSLTVKNLAVIYQEVK